MPRGAAPRALLGVIVLIIAFAVTLGPAVDARPKEKKSGNQETVSTETSPVEADVQTLPEASEPQQSNDGAETGSGDAVEHTDGANGGAGSNERTLLSSDADGDYLPDALDNCPNVQNPDQADADSDGVGDACPIYQDYDGDGVADKDDNCPNIATFDFADRDGDGIGDACDKSPDGIEPEPEPLPDYDGQGGEGAAEAPEPVNGEGQDGQALERDGKTRSKQRNRTENAKPIITTGDDTAEDGGAQDDGSGGDGEAITEGPDAVPYEEPARDNPRRNEALVAEAAASGELYTPAQPPPAATRAWDEDAAVDSSWEAIVRIDSGVTENATAARAADDGPAGATAKQSSESSKKNRDRKAKDQSDQEAGDSGFARGWMRARILLQDEAPPEDETGDGEGDQGSAPVPVENGLVIKGNERDSTRDEGRQIEKAADPETGDAIDDAAQEQGDTPPDSDDETVADAPQRIDRSARDERGDGNSRKDGSRRDGSSRAAAASPNHDRSNGGSNGKDNNQGQNGKKSGGKGANDNENKDKSNEGAKKGDKGRGKRGAARREDRSVNWNDDRYFDGGSALDWTGDFAVAGTDDEALYLTQRSGSGSGKRRGFTYAIPVEESGAYLVRLYFAEPYWGAPDGPKGEAGKRVFSVSAEGDAFIDDLDIYDEAGAMTALIKQAEVTVDDGELNLAFVASEGEPVVAAIEVLQPAG